MGTAVAGAGVGTVKEKPIWEDWRRQANPPPAAVRDDPEWMPRRSPWRFRWLAILAAGISMTLVAIFALAFGHVDQWTNGRGFQVLAGGMQATGIAAAALGAYGWMSSRRRGPTDKACRTACWLGIAGFLAPGILGIGLQGYSLTFEGTHEGTGVCSDRDLRATIISASSAAGPSPGLVLRVVTLAPYAIEVTALRVSSSGGNFMELRTNTTSIASGGNATITFVPYGADYAPRDVGTFATNVPWSDFTLWYSRDVTSGRAAGMRCHIVGDGLPEAFIR